MIASDRFALSAASANELFCKVDLMNDVVPFRLRSVPTLGLALVSVFKGRHQTFEDVDIVRATDQLKETTLISVCQTFPSEFLESELPSQNR